MGKTKDLTDFEWGTIVGARRLGFSISKMADVRGISCTTVSWLFREWKLSHNLFSFLVNKRSERWLAWIIQANRRATTRQIAVQYNSGTLQTIPTCTTWQTLEWIGFNSRRAPRVPMLSLKKRKSRLLWAQECLNWTPDDWKKLLRLMNLISCSIMQMAGSEYGANRTHSWTPLA